MTKSQETTITINHIIHSCQTFIATSRIRCNLIRTATSSWKETTTSSWKETTPSSSKQTRTSSLKQTTTSSLLPSSLHDICKCMLLLFASLMLLLFASLLRLCINVGLISLHSRRHKLMRILRTMELSVPYLLSTFLARCLSYCFAFFRAGIALCRLCNL